MSTKRKVKTKEEITDEAREKAEMARQQECASELYAVLQKHGYGLYPFIRRTDNGETAEVRLIKQPAHEEKKGEVSEGQS